MSDDLSRFALGSTTGPSKKRKSGRVPSALAQFSADRPSDLEPDPLAEIRTLGPPDDLEERSDAEVAAIDEGFRGRMRREGDRFRRATDSEFWFAVCFTSREAKEAFLDESGLIELGDKYINGHQAARILDLGCVPDEH